MRVISVSFINCLTTAEPMNPAPPVMSTVFIFRTLIVFCSIFYSRPWADEICPCISPLLGPLRGPKQISYDNQGSHIPALFSSQRGSKWQKESVLIAIDDIFQNVLDECLN